MRINFTLLLCFCVLSLADGYTMHKSIITPFCDEGNLRLALNSATAYNTAFAWSKKADLNGWSFHRGLSTTPKLTVSDTHIQRTSAYPANSRNMWAIYCARYK